MKKIYMKPIAAMFVLASQTALLEGSDDSYRINGINMDQNEYGGSCAKKHGFSLWDAGSDETEENSLPDGFSAWD